MDTKQKYVKLQEFDSIIIFPIVIEHSTFKHLNPVTAGFCYVNGTDEKVTCFDESFSLNLKSDEKEDSLIATKQIFGYEAMLKLQDDYE